MLINRNTKEKVDFWNIEFKVNLEFSHHRSVIWDYCVLKIDILELSIHFFICLINMDIWANYLYFIMTALVRTCLDTWRAHLLKHLSWKTSNIFAIWWFIWRQCQYESVTLMVEIRSTDEYLSSKDVHLVI